jgi:hypothetical protein
LYDFQYSRELFDPSSTTGNKVNGMMMPKARKVTKVLQRDRELGCKTLMLDHNLLLQKSLGIIILAPTDIMPCMSLLPQEPKILAKGSCLSWNPQIILVIWTAIWCVPLVFLTKILPYSPRYTKRLLMLWPLCHCKMVRVPPTKRKLTPTDSLSTPWPNQTVIRHS